MELKAIVYSLKDLSYIDESEANNYLENPHDHACERWERTTTFDKDESK